MNDQTTPVARGSRRLSAGRAGGRRGRAHAPASEECEACRAEYAELAPVVGLLAKVPAEAFAAEQYSADEAPDPAMWERLR
jgi:hypothetical protein